MKWLESALSFCLMCAMLTAACCHIAWKAVQGTKVFRIIQCVLGVLLVLAILAVSSWVAFSTIPGGNW